MRNSRRIETSLLVALAMTAMASACPALAQTRFQWPDTSETLTRYSNIEKCLAAIDRVNASVVRREGLTLWRDTMPRDEREALEPPPAEAVAIAKQCSARFVEAKVEIRDFAPAQRLFLAAGRDSDAAALVDRRIAAAATASARDRSIVIDSAVTIYVNAKPSRLSAAEALLARRLHGTTDRVERLRTYASLLRASQMSGDSARTARVAKWIVGIADSLTIAERQSEPYQKLGEGNGGDMLIYDALDELTGLPARLDSLRHGTEQYAALERALWSKATGERLNSLQIPVGQHPPPLTADFWYSSEPAAKAHPTPGRTALVLFLEHSDCIGSASDDDALESTQCAMRLAEIRRLVKRFPTLEINVVMSTHGQFMYLPPPAVADEAALIHQWFDAYHVSNAVLGVTSTPYWRLPDPDGRRIDKPTPNVDHYTFRKSWRTGSGSMFLVDSDGKIANAWRFREKELGEYIEVLMQRQTKGN